MFVGSFEGDFVQFQTDTINAFAAFKNASVSQLIIDLTNNGGELPVPVWSLAMMRKFYIDVSPV